MKEVQNFQYFCYVIHQIKLRAGLSNWNFWVGQVDQPDILDLCLTVRKSGKKNGLDPLFNDISWSECGQYKSQCSTKISF